MYFVIKCRGIMNVVIKYNYYIELKKKLLVRHCLACRIPACRSLVGNLVGALSDGLSGKLVGWLVGVVFKWARGSCRGLVGCLVGLPCRSFLVAGGLFEGCLVRKSCRRAVSRRKSCRVLSDAFSCPRFFSTTNNGFLLAIR